MTIFADRHHDALYASFQMLFEKRLGHTLYHPYGMDWFDSGNWLLGAPYGDTARNTALQFLDSALPEDGTAILFPHSGISFEEFKHMHIDIIIASYYPHIELYEKLRQEFHPNAKLITQYGNEWPLHPMTRNLLSSTKPFPVPATVNACFYHQEFDTTLFAPDWKERETYLELGGLPQMLCSYVNALPCNDLFAQDNRDFYILSIALQGYAHVLSFGGGCKDGSLSQGKLAESMRRSRFALHFKEGGDGFGHVIHQLAATGTPIIFKGHQYKGKLAEVFLEDGKTGIDADLYSLDEVAKRIKSASTDEILTMSHEIYRRFCEHVNFDTEQPKIEHFLANLQ